MSKVDCPDCGGAGGLFISRCERCGGSGKVEAHESLKASGVHPVPARVDSVMMLAANELRAAMRNYIGEAMCTADRSMSLIDGGTLRINIRYVLPSDFRAAYGISPLTKVLNIDGNPTGDDDAEP